MESQNFEFSLRPSGEGLLWALWRIHRNKVNGVLDIQWEKFRKQILFIAGEPAITKSNWSYEALGNFLVRKKFITMDQLRAEIATMENEKPRPLLGEWLVKQGLLDSAQMPAILEGHFRERVFNLLSLSHGLVSFKEAPQEKFPAEAIRMTEPFGKLLWESVRQLFTPAVTRGKLSPYLSRAARATKDFPLPLAGPELRAWNQLMATELKVEGLDETSMRLLAAASEFGIVQWGQSPEDKFSIELKEIEKRFVKATPYQILEVEPKSSPDEAKKAFLKLVKRLHPDRLPPSSSVELKKLSEAVFAKINEAYSILTDPEKRADFEARQELESSGGVDQIQERLQAEMSLPQAKMALKRRHFKTALELFEEIRKVLTDDGEVLADTAFALLMSLVESKVDTKSKMPKIKEEITKALQLSPNYAGGYYYRGMILKMEGHYERALEDFDRALDIDPKMTEASSEARVIRMRKDKSSPGFFKKK